LFDQFFQDICNNRSDSYGGSIPNRSRFFFEVLEAIVARIGEEKVGARFSPWSTFKGMKMIDPVPQFTYLVTQLAKHYPRFSYVHFVESRASAGFDVPSDMLNELEANDFAREIWGKTGRPFLVSGGFTPENALEHMGGSDGEGKGRERDVIVFGKWFISNPDLVRRIAYNSPLTQYDRSTFYIPESPVGYIDYPFRNFREEGEEGASREEDHRAFGM